MKLINLLNVLFGFSLLQATIYLENGFKLENGKILEGNYKSREIYRALSNPFDLRSQAYVYKIGDYASQFIGPMQIFYRLSSDSNKELEITDVKPFLEIVSRMHTPDETLINTMKRVFNEVKLTYNMRCLHLIFQQHCIRDQELEILSNLTQNGQFDQKSAEILGNRMIDESNSEVLKLYKVKITLENEDSQSINLMDLINIIRDPTMRKANTKMEFDAAEYFSVPSDFNKYSILRCEYGLEGKVECGPLGDLLANPELFDRLSYLYIIEHKPNDYVPVRRYSVIRPVGECTGIGVSLHDYSGSISRIKANLVPGKNSMLIMSNPDKWDLYAFRSAHDALLSSYAVEFFAEHGLDINQVLSENGIELSWFSNKSYIVIHGASVGVAMFVAMCSAIIGKPIDPGVVFTGIMRSDGSVDWVQSTPAKTKVLIDLGYRCFGIPKLSLRREFSRGQFADSGKFPQLEAGEGLVHKVHGHDFHVHGLRGVADVLKLAFGFETKLDPNLQMMSYKFLLKNPIYICPNLVFFLYERGYFEKQIEEINPFEIFLCKKRKTS